MSTQKLFRVIIVGGSVSGLSLANMLQKNGIEYIILEAYPEIAPQVGASIGFLPHGLRILDQLGMYEDLQRLTHPIDYFSFRNDKGELLAEHAGVVQSFVERHGYPMRFLERQTLLRLLYDHLEDKSKVLTNKRFSAVDFVDGGVKVTTKDGSVYLADILVGADGIHSVVRNEMWRIGNEVSPGYFPANEANEVPCDYGCIFGISLPCVGIKAGSFTSAFGHRTSYLILGGLNDRVYWFHFFKLGKGRVYGANIPQFSKEDEAAIINEHQHDPIMPGLAFGDIVKNMIHCNISSLAEYAYQKWHFGRIITIGDSAHKFEPIGGQGANAAIESSALLVNHLVKTLDKSSSGTLTDAEIASIFYEVQSTRQARVQKLIADSHEQQRLESLDTLVHKILALKVLPIMDIDNVLFSLSKNVPQGKMLDMIKLPVRPLLIPYNDQLLSEPKHRGSSGWLMSTVFFILASVGYWGVHLRPVSLGLYDHLNSTLKNSRFPDNGAPFRQLYTKNPSIDQILSLPIAHIIYGAAGWNQDLWMLQLYFLGSLWAVIVVWSVEACRKRNTLTFICSTTMWAIVYQTLGIAVAGPLYYAAYVFTSRDETYWWPLSRQVPTPLSKSLLPALFLGYILPTILVFLPFDLNTQHIFAAVWQASPFYINILLWLYSTVYAHIYPQNHSTPEANEPLPDMGDLRLLYAVTFAITALTHFFTIFTIIRTPQLTFTTVFVPRSRTGPFTMAEGLLALWQANLWICFISSVFWCYISVWDLKRVGRSRVDLKKAAAALILATVSVGPGASLAGFWYWREIQMARTSFK